MADEIVSLPKLKVDDLKKELVKRGLKTKGTKAELQERLLDYLKNEVTDNANNEDNGENDLDTNEESNENNDLGNSTEEDEIEVITNQEPDNLNIKVGEKEVKETDSTYKTGPGETKADKPLKTSMNINKITNEAEKRLQRAKRFGEVTNEIDKKKMRAERFKSSEVSSDVVFKGKKITGDEMDILKKRAERFGVISPVLEKIDESDRKLKRQERFGVVTSISTVPSGGNLNARKKKRAERFGL